MNLEKLEPIKITYGKSEGVYDPATDLIKLTVHGETMTLAVDGVQANPELIADFPPDASYIFGWINSHVAHQKQLLVWLASGVLSIHEKLDPPLQ